MKYNDCLKQDEKEVWLEVKQYYRDIAKFDQDKKDKEKAIMDRLAAYYNAASGQKAEEMRKRFEAMMRSIEEGQILNQEVVKKLDQRVALVADLKAKKGACVGEVNRVSEQVKYGVYENDE